MERLIKKHLLPVKRRKSSWVSSDLVYIRHLINQTIANPDQTEPHNDNNDKIVLFIINVSS